MQINEIERAGLFPKLSEGQIETLSESGSVREIRKGEYLVKVGERNHNIFVVLKGSLSILNNDLKEIAIHHPGEFTGNIDNLSDRTAIYNAVATSDSLILQIAQPQLRDIISNNQDLSEILLRTFLLRRTFELESNIGALKLLGSRFCPNTFKLREFFSKNHVQYTWVDLEMDETSEAILSEFGVSASDTPLVITHQKTIFKNPTLEEIADNIGLTSLSGDDVYDLIVVGAGPAGLAASVYASSEGLKVITIDSIGPGGQAGTSSKIENYLGFPMGISGSDLANNAFIQAQKFGCVISIPHNAKALRVENNAFHLELATGKVIKGSAVIAATGAQYRKLPLDNLVQFEGQGVYYGASNMEAQLLSGKEAVIVGGGNSAGQAAIFLAEKSSKIHLVIRGSDLSASMSTYLINRIVHHPKIELHIHTEVKKLEGDSWLRKVTLECNQSGEIHTCNVSDLFLFLGALPCTEWLADVTCLDPKGFIYTGRDIPADGLETYKWPYSYPPQSLETCVPGLFAVGDIRSGSVKRVASAVGEGSMAVSQVHAFLSNQRVF